MKIKLRLFTATELLADPEFQAAWQTNKSMVLDRAIMKRYPLDRWLRQLMPRELELEREDIRQKKTADVAAWNCRLIQVANRELGVRHKWTTHIPELDQNSKEIEIDAAELADLKPLDLTHTHVLMSDGRTIPLDYSAGGLDQLRADAAPAADVAAQWKILVDYFHANPDAVPDAALWKTLVDYFQRNPDALSEGKDRPRGERRH